MGITEFRLTFCSPDNWTIISALTKVLLHTMPLLLSKNSFVAFQEKSGLWALDIIINSYLSCFV